MSSCCNSLGFEAVEPGTILLSVIPNVRQINDMAPSTREFKETLKVLHCYTQGIAASLIAYLICSAVISTLCCYFGVYSALIASFKLIVEKTLLQQAGVAAAATMSPPEAARSKRAQEIQGRNRGAR